MSTFCSEQDVRMSRLLEPGMIHGESHDLRASPCSVSEWNWITFEVAMKTQGEIEAGICEGISRFEQEYMVLSLHHDISTVTGEEVILFTLTDSPLFREAKKK
jgi:hypothetical protein